jgi:lantibiotic biosynthesis protein
VNVPGLADAAERYAAALAVPVAVAGDQPWAGQSLGRGSAGVCLLHSERASTGHGTWRQAHVWITRAASGAISVSDRAGLYQGAPAIGFILDVAARGSGRYRAALAEIDRHLAALTLRRAATAMARIGAGALPVFGEYDIFTGLAGLGALQLRRDPGGPALEAVLRYLVALTRPLRADGGWLPGWWVSHDPHRRQSAEFAGGHANLGAAHGISGGPLLLLAQAARRGITIDGHAEAIGAICGWLDTWRQESAAGPWWPQWISLTDLRAGQPTQTRPARPSYCYGLPGISRALQLAAIATRDTGRQHSAEHALARCLTDPAQLAQLDTGGLCHGWAGTYQTTWRAARDATTPDLGELLPALAAGLAGYADPDPAAGPGFLDGNSGIALALHTAAYGTVGSDWDAAMLID